MISYHTCPLAATEGKETGGMNVYVLELSKQLAKLGYAIDIYTRMQDVTQPHIVSVSESIRVIHIQAGPQKTIPKKLWKLYLDEFGQNLLKHIKATHTIYDLLHAHYYLSGVIGLRMKKQMSNIPLVMSFHTLALMKNLVARDELEREDDERISLEIELTKKVDHVIATSSTDKEYLSYLYGCDPNKISVVHPGVDVSVFRPLDKQVVRKNLGVDPAHKLILFVGRIEPLKGIDMLLYAIKILREKDDIGQLCVWLVGGDISSPKREWSKEMQRLEKLRHILGLSGVVRFVGQKTQEELPMYYNAADLVVIPSHYESFGMATLEAMACGTPVITTNVTGIASLLDEEQEKYIASVNNPLLLATQMEELLDSTIDRGASKDAIATARKLTWEDVAKRMEQIYNDLLGR